MGNSAFQTLKLYVVELLGLSKDALHIHLGVAIMMAAALALRKPLSSPLPWIAALCAGFVAEAWDAGNDIGTFGRWRWNASLHDLLNTLLWPTLLMALARKYGSALAASTKGRWRVDEEVR